jgi:hypothetical protein
MGLVNPRPAMRKRERAYREAILKRHAELMAQFIGEGMDRDAASRKAFALVKSAALMVAAGHKDRSPP